ncbi:protein LEKR1 isoform X2 [Trichomycterus rosablanca]|uniref:protein LEKR1 isoform X2 n=1 Tax=Trichomycterus rosablanca TaxID=2290929 RepID=UPI002F35AF95
MEDQQGRDSGHQELTIHTPSHPLPVEIQQMEAAETSCCYCGVSYLILHEFQRLQEHLREVERELELERGSVERERETRRELQSARVQLRELRAAQQLHQERLEALELQASLTARELQDAQTERATLRAELDEELGHGTRLRTVCKRQRGALRDARTLLQSCAAELHAVKREISPISRHWDASRAAILQHSSAARSECAGLREKVVQDEVERVRLQQEVQELQGRLNTSQLKIRELEGRVQNQELLQRQNQRDQLHIQELQQEVEALQEALQEEVQRSRSDRERVEELLQTKQKEEEERNSEHRLLSDQQSATIHSLSRDLKEKEESWLSGQQRCQFLQQQLLTWQQKEAETRRELEGALQEGQKFRDEREALQRAQEEELQEQESTFRRRLELSQVENAQLKSEKVEMMKLLEQSECELRRDFTLELDIQRQKNQQLVDQYQSQYQTLQDQLPALVASAAQELRDEVSELEARLRVREVDLQRVREERSHLEKQHQGTTLELEKLLRDVRQLGEENSGLTDENALLQETVRRECEERAELTAALSLARERLLGIGQAPSGPLDSHRSVRSSLPSLTPSHARDSTGGGRSAASWHDSSRQKLPALPRLDSERATSVSGPRQRVNGEASVTTNPKPPTRLNPPPSLSTHMHS